MFVIYLTFSILILAYYISTRRYQYWKNKKVPYLEPSPLFGNYGNYFLQREALPSTIYKICQAFPTEPYVGAYYGTEPVLIVQDPEIIKTILTKEFPHFHGREISDHIDKEAGGQNLFAAHGDRWKVLRQNLTPLFSTAKMKNMFHLIQKTSYTLESVLDNNVQKDNPVNIKTLSKNYTLTCLTASVFGIDAQVLDNVDKHNPIKKIANVMLDISVWRMTKFNIRNVWPSIFYGLNFKIFPRQISYLVQLVKNVLKERDFKPSSRHDFVDLLLGWIEKGSISGDGLHTSKDKEAKRVTLQVDDELLLAQCLVMFGAGFETSSLTLSHTLFELAKNKDAQERVHEEVDAFLEKHENRLTYDCVTELPYLEACVEEALRLYPVLGMVSREVMDDFTLPTGLRLEKNLRIQIPVYHLHRHPDYFQDPEEFRPERFLGEARREVNPYIFMPFGEGPRVCIGMRFAKMQMFACLVTILKKYEVELAPGMSLTLQMMPRSFSLVTGDINLTLIPRDGWLERKFQQ